MTERSEDGDQVFYRIIRGERPSLDDFRSAKALGKPLRNRRLVRQWSEGISVYDSLNYAAEQVRLYQFKLGRFIVPLRIPDSAGIEREQWETDPYHYTLDGDPAQLLHFADTGQVAVEEE
ncbi:MAG: hypothetical protein ACRDJH_27450 [Thermomicrobiales bacterium]